MALKKNVQGNRPVQENNSLSYAEPSCINRPMLFNCALVIISQDNNALCRRLMWGQTPTHIYAEVSSAKVENIMLIDENGGLHFYTPSIDDIIAKDWVVIQN